MNPIRASVLAAVLIFSACVSCPSEGRAADSAPSPAPASAPGGTISRNRDGEGKSSQGSRDSVKKRKGGSHSREKEAEGTEAYDRFKADTAIKSRYHLNGQPLEVDPD